MALRKSIIEYAESLGPDGYFTIEQLRDEMIAREGHNFRLNSLEGRVQELVDRRQLTELFLERYCICKRTPEEYNRISELLIENLAAENDPLYMSYCRDRERRRERRAYMIERGLIRVDNPEKEPATAPVAG